MSYIDSLAEDIRLKVPEDAIPEGDVASLFRLYALLALSKGQAVTPKDVHDAWAVWMSGEDPNHPAIRPFDQLSQGTRQEDRVFVKAIHAAVVLNGRR